MNFFSGGDSGNGKMDTSLVLRNGRMLALLGIPTLGTFLYFIAICILQSTITNYLNNPLGVAWFHMFYFVFLIGLLFSSVVYSNVPKLRPALVGFIALGVAFAIDEIKVSADATVSRNGVVSATSALRLSGMLLFVLPMFYNILFFGADESVNLPTLSFSIRSGNN